MAKSPVKAPATAAPKPVAAKAKPKSPAKAKAVAAEPLAVVKQAASAKAKPAAKKVAPKAAAPSPKPKAAPAKSGVGKLAHDTADAIAKLASDVLEDRIIPTIEQIKSIAAHALGRDAPPTVKPKAKRSPKK